jgi:RNA polymerase sigma factor (sigma-70 family)
MKKPRPPSKKLPSPPQPAGAPAGVLDDIVQQLVGNEAAFRAFLRRRVNDEALAEDLLQQSLVRAVEHHHSLKQQESVVPWFYRILRHAMIDYYRSQASEARKHDAFLQELTASGEDKAAPLDAVKPTVCACLYKLLPAIRPNYAELLRRVDLEGESPDAVAHELKLSRNNFTVRLHRARQALRASLEESCGICSKHGCLNCACE